MLVILLSALPLALSSSLLAWHDNVASAERGSRRTDGLLLAFLANEQTAISGVGDTLQALAAMPDLTSPVRCQDLANLAVAFSGNHLDGLVVTRGGGEICASGRAISAFRPVATARNAGQARLGSATSDGLGGFVVPISARRPGSSPDVEVAADIRLVQQPGTISVDASVSPTREIWLLDDRGVPHSLCPTCPDVPPSRAVIARLLAGDSSVSEFGHAGKQHLFSIGHLANGARVVVGDQATDTEARASALLFRRFAAIALLLATGLAVVAIGGHVTVSAPLRALTRRVERWREAGVFDMRPMPFVPAELVDLHHAFGQATAALATREQQLARAGTEQELLIKEIHHRVKNNLQIIASLLNLQASRIRAPAAKAEFQSARDRVRALATLHRHLYADGGLHTIAMRGFLLELCGQLFQAMGEREGSRIQLDVVAPELQMSSDQAVPIALIITEAVSNALKYAFPQSREGHISVCLRVLTGDRVELVIQDDGIGIPAGRAETETGIRDGLGLQLIRGFARQLGAAIEITERDGTRYQLVLDLHRGHVDDPRPGLDSAAPVPARTTGA